MERNKKPPLLFLLLFVMLQVSTITGHSCVNSQDERLTCYNDYSRIITCVWNDTHAPDHADAACTLSAKRVNTTPQRAYSARCDLQPIDVSRPELKTGSLDFKKNGNFQSFHELSITASCNPAKQNLTIYYRPVCHIKLNPPGKPSVNFTTVFWLTQVMQHGRIKLFSNQLQWKRGDQSWSDPAVQKPPTPTQCDWPCKAQLQEDLLVQGERYEVRVRVQATDDGVRSTWSDWSPTASWVSPIGELKPEPDIARRELGMIAGGAVFALILALILKATNDKATWIYKKIRGPPPPDPGKSFLKNYSIENTQSPHFIIHPSCPPFWKPEEITFEEIISAVDSVTCCTNEAALLEKMRRESSFKSSSSSFSNPSYSQLCSPPPPPPLPPVSSPTTGNLRPCAADTPNGSAGSQGEARTAEQDREEERRKEMELLQLLSIGNKNTEPVQMVSGYEKVEKLQVERIRLQSLDSGMCSGEEVSQESLETDSINAADSLDEGGKEEERAGNNGKVDFQKLFGGSGFSKGSIQVCSDYERVQALQPGSPELASLDSGVSSRGEEQASHEESPEDVDKSLISPHESMSSPLPPPPPSCALPCSVPCFAQLTLKLCGTGLSPALQLPSQSHMLERIALISASRSVELSGDGYMPARQDQS